MTLLAGQNVAVKVTPGRTVLQASDFTYLGSYDVYTNSLDTPYNYGLTHRYVNGDLRFMSLQFSSSGPKKLGEFSIAGLAYGAKITALTNAWPMTALQAFTGFWWEDAKQRLWYTTSEDYTTAYHQARIYTCTLNIDGTVSNLYGPVGMSGIPQKRVYGGAQPVPLWFQQQYGVGPYVVGWGGYTSLLAQGGGCSMGPSMYAIPEPSTIPAGTETPVGTFKTVLDCVSGAQHATDWYAAGHPTTFDRGTRATIPNNQFDAPNWQSPAPDGLGRWTWGDSYYNTGCWIDGAQKHGFVMVASLGEGTCWYQNSTLNSTSRGFELHVFNPYDLGAVAQGTKSAWLVHPTTMLPLTLPGLGGSLTTGNSTPKNISGATYDPATGRLYLVGYALTGSGYLGRLYAFQVAQ